ncbi:hypothetical protein PAPHI01_2344 [Pancytospora philotis]|nr:hypothetical protein PAPHI01_2344 [Pancytospora philotis]
MSSTIPSSTLATTTEPQIVQGLPTFHGAFSEDVIRWIRYFDLARQTRNLSDPQSRLLLVCSLSGEAANFYTYIDGDAQPLEIVLGELKKRFDTSTNIPKAQELLESLEKNPDESWTGFAERFITLARRCNLPEHFQVSWITTRLPENMQVLLSTLRLQDADVTPDGIVYALKQSQLRGLDIMLATQKAMSVSAIKPKRPRKHRPKRHCDHHGMCGHASADCRVLKNKSGSSYTLCSLTASHSSLFSCTAKLVGSQDIIKAVIDTGSKVTCIHADLALAAGLQGQGMMQLQGADGKEFVARTATNVTLMAYEHSWNTNILLVPNLIHPMIIGGELLKDMIETLGAEALFATRRGLATPVPTQAVCSIANQFTSIMAETIDARAPTHLPVFVIDTGNAVPIARCRYRLGKPMDAIVETEVAKLLAQGIIRESNSPWSSPVVLQKKKDGTHRLCVDYTALNSVTIRDCYPLPRIEDILDSLAGACIFTTLDATSGYHQIPLAPEDIPKTAFQTRTGLYEYTRMPFGLMNAPSVFQRCMDAIFKDIRGLFLQVYLDDIIIYSKNRAEHERHLHAVLQRLKEVGLRLKRAKCHFFKEELEVLGYRLRANTLQPLESRVKSIKDFPEPTTIQELRSFLGLVSYCRNFIEDLARISAPLADMLKGAPALSTKITFDAPQREAFTATRESISADAHLALPDYSQSFILTTDASNVAMSGILGQKNQTGVEVAVGYFSKKLTDAQTRYSATHRELLAVVESMKFFKPYLLHKKFLLRTDHQALTALKHTKNQNSIIFRWSLQLSEFEFDVEYIKGPQNPADALSRVATVSVGSLVSCKHQLVTDPLIRQQLIRDYHIESGHSGPGSTIYSLRQKYEWPGLYTDVHNAIRACEPCLRAANAVGNTNYYPILTSLLRCSPF